jgi:hypothetical protein
MHAIASVFLFFTSSLIGMDDIIFPYLGNDTRKNNFIPRKE